MALDGAHGLNTWEDFPIPPTHTTLPHLFSDTNRKRLDKNRPFLAFTPPMLLLPSSNIYPAPTRFHPCPWEAVTHTPSSY